MEILFSLIVIRIPYIFARKVSRAAGLTTPAEHHDYRRNKQKMLWKNSRKDHQYPFPSELNDDSSHEHPREHSLPGNAEINKNDPETGGGKEKQHQK